MIRLAIRVARDDAELVLADLMAFAPGGLEEREDGEIVEYALYGAPGELPDVGDLRAAVGSTLVEVSTSELPDVDWHDFHQPIDVGAVRVRPPWEPARDGALDVVIEPGQAFGTGSHATTRLTLELLTRLTPRGALADWGCGSGVLAIAAAKLGWSPVLACDIEPESVEAAGVAARENGVSIEVSRCDVRQGGPQAPNVVANLVRPLLLELARHLTFEPDNLIISGLELHEVDEVVDAFSMVELDRRENAGWAAVHLTPY